MTSPGPARVPPTALAMSLSCKFIEQFPRYSTLIERKRLVTDYLIGLVSLTREDDRVSGRCHLQRIADRLPAIGYNLIVPSLNSPRAANAGLHFVDDGQRVLGARIVRGNDGKVAPSHRHFSHQR